MQDDKAGSTRSLVLSDAFLLDLEALQWQEGHDLLLKRCSHTAEALELHMPVQSRATTMPAACCWQVCLHAQESVGSWPVRCAQYRQQTDC